jgi:hypothetical protein
MRLFIFVFIALCMSVPTQAAIVIGFEELSVFTGNNPAGGGQFYNGNDGTGTTNSNGWTSGGVFFSNRYNGDFLPNFDFWSGWGYSNVANATTAGFTNQYAAFPGGGANASGGVVVGGQYAVAAGSGAFFNLPNQTFLASVQLTNTTYTGLSMRDGDQFAKKFGGPSGNDPDFFRVALNGFDGLSGTGSLVGSVVVDLADYTFADNTQDYILGEWLTVDLSSLAGARSVVLSFSSSDVGAFGINTPLYLAMDNLTLSVVPEPSSLLLLIAASAFVPNLLRHRRRG